MGFKKLKKMEKYKCFFFLFFLNAILVFWEGLKEKKYQKKNNNFIMFQ